MQRIPLTDRLSVSGQVTPPDLEALASAGVRGVIDNRPDGESPDQPSSTALAAEARRLGLAFHYVPVVPGGWNADTVADFARALGSIAGPVHAFCRSGMRSTTMWAMQACAAGADVNGVMQQARQAGYDLAPLYDTLRRAGHTA